MRNGVVESEGGPASVAKTIERMEVGVYMSLAARLAPKGGHGEIQNRHRGWCRQMYMACIVCSGAFGEHVSAVAGLPLAHAPYCPFPTPHTCTLCCAQETASHAQQLVPTFDVYGTPARSAASGSGGSGAGAPGAVTATPVVPTVTAHALNFSEIESDWQHQADAVFASIDALKGLFTGPGGPVFPGAAEPGAGQGAGPVAASPSAGSTQAGAGAHASTAVAAREAVKGAEGADLEGLSTLKESVDKLMQMWRALAARAQAARSGQAQAAGTDPKFTPGPYTPVPDARYFETQAEAVLASIDELRALYNQKQAEAAAARKAKAAAAAAGKGGSGTEGEAAAAEGSAVSPVDEMQVFTDQVGTSWREPHWG